MQLPATNKKLKTFHAAMHVTRLEEWCVEAETAEQAKELLAMGTAIAVPLATAFMLN